MHKRKFIQDIIIMREFAKGPPPGIRKLANERGNQMNKDRRSHLNILLIRQAYLTRKLQQGSNFKLPELRQVQLLIEQWYDQECSKIALQSRVDDIHQSEKI